MKIMLANKFIIDPEHLHLIKQIKCDVYNSKTIELVPIDSNDFEVVDDSKIHDQTLLSKNKDDKIEKLTKENSEYESKLNKFEFIEKMVAQGVEREKVKEKIKNMNYWSYYRMEAEDFLV